MLQAFPAGNRTDEMGVGFRGRVGPVDRVLELDCDLEEIGEVRVGRKEHVVERAVTEKDHLDVQGDRVGLEGLGGHHRHAVGR